MTIAQIHSWNTRVRGFEGLSLRLIQTTMRSLREEGLVDQRSVQIDRESIKRLGYDDRTSSSLLVFKLSLDRCAPLAVVILALLLTVFTQKTW